MKPIKVSAPSKIHLLGEHAVVYGKPAIIAAIDKRCFVEITSKKEKEIEIVSQNPLLYTRHSGKEVPDGTSASRISNHSERFWTSQNDEENIYTSGFFTEKEILHKTEHARKQWESYRKTNDTSVLKSITANSLDYVVICIGETLRYFGKKLPFGFRLSIQSEIPIGSGMGSSAALAVSIAGAISILFTNKIDKEAVNEIAFRSEEKKHGSPSGGDNSACCFGGLIWFRKETPDFKIIKSIPFLFPQKLAKNFVAIHTGVPVESTGEMVSIMRSLYQKKPKFMEGILSSQEKLARELLSAIKSGNAALMIRIIRAGEKNLENLGVVSKFSKLIIREIEVSGGAAKICGGGGKTRGTGILLAYHPDKRIVKRIAKNFKLSCFSVSLGEDGVRKEYE